MLSRFLSRGWRIMGIGALMAASLVVAAPASAGHGGSHSLQPVAIECLDKNDVVGRDEPYIKLSGVTVWAGQDFAVGTSQSLLTVPARSFMGQVNIDLWEDDAGPSGDDFLGRATVLHTDAGDGDRTATFSQDGALYEITYRVS